MPEQVVCWQVILSRQRDNPLRLGISERIAEINDRIGVLGGGRGKGNVEFFGLGRRNERQRHAEVPGYAGDLFREVQPLQWIVWIEQNCDFRCAWNKFSKDF